MGEGKEVLYEKRGRVALITINRPEKRNPLSKEVREGILEGLAEAEKDGEVRAVVLTGAGDKSFAAGADLRELEARSTRDGIVPSIRVDRAVENFPKPVIAAVNGYALGGGCELAMACTFRVASEKAKFGQPEVDLGIIPGMGGTQRLVRLVGLSRAVELVLLGEMIDAEKAREIGLVHHVVPHEELIPFSLSLGEKLAEKPPLALRLAKECLLKASSLPLPEGLDYEMRAFALLLDTEDKREGIRAVLEKRKPRFTGR
ncbi:MAG: crotonase [Deltaproteobacteria bacterium]|nr:MAG: crotonase [Deltaproteobacteria bacterium]